MNIQEHAFQRQALAAIDLYQPVTKFPRQCHGLSPGDLRVYLMPPLHALEIGAIVSVCPPHDQPPGRIAPDAVHPGGHPIGTAQSFDDFAIACQ